MKEQILKLKSQGKSYNEIKKELGCSKGTISYYLGHGRKERTVAATKARRLKDRREIKLKHGGCCSKCGYSKCLAALQFHHIEPINKKFGITEALRSSKLKYSMEEIQKESEKCILLCANCHLELHYPE
jgi:5-methylcytosine-specific restriction endonuclease McrA